MVVGGLKLNVEMDECVLNGLSGWVCNKYC